MSAMRTITRSIVALSIGAWAVALQAAAPAADASAGPETFASPEKAAQALVAAAGTYDLGALKVILGPDGVDLVVTEDEVQSKNQSLAFAEKAKEKLRVARDAKNPAVATIVVGKDDWPMPIPLVEREGKWVFDTKAGRKEILYRRIGQNELDAIQICHGYVEAQRDYASERHDGSLLNEYAQRIVSTPGKHDGLAWQEPDGTWAGPVGEGIARVIAEGYSDRREPYHGYYFKVLKSQGPSAPMGAMDFVVKGAMIGGFALVAAPSDYEVTGIKTFIVSHTGTVYEKDLGQDTLDKFKAMDTYDPDSSWHKVVEH
jgi:hypothetical protein